jgi:hypothetical protein
MPHLPDYAICVMLPSRGAAADPAATTKGVGANSANSLNPSWNLGSAALST